MDAKELRIGNLINRKYLNRVEIDTVSGYDLWYSEKLNEPNHLVEWNAISEIPLTIDWLLRLGFKKDEDKGWSSSEEITYDVYSLRSVDIAIVDGKFKFWNEIDGDTWYNFAWFEIFTVHGLQNIYFDIYHEMLVVAL